MTTADLLQRLGLDQAQARGLAEKSLQALVADPTAIPFRTLNAHHGPHVERFEPYCNWESASLFFNSGDFPEAHLDDEVEGDAADQWLATHERRKREIDHDRKLWLEVYRARRRATRPVSGVPEHFPEWPPLGESTRDTGSNWFLDVVSNTLLDQDQHGLSKQQYETCLEAAELLHTTGHGTPYPHDLFEVEPSNDCYRWSQAKPRHARPAA